MLQLLDMSFKVELLRLILNRILCLDKTIWIQIAELMIFEALQL